MDKQFWLGGDMGIHKIEDDISNCFYGCLKLIHMIKKFNVRTKVWCYIGIRNFSIRIKKSCKHLHVQYVGNERDTNLPNTYYSCVYDDNNLPHINTGNYHHWIDISRKYIAELKEKTSA